LREASKDEGVGNSADISPYDLLDARVRRLDVEIAVLHAAEQGEGVSTLERETAQPQFHSSRS